jgi:hypothetical protein
MAEVTGLRNNVLSFPIYGLPYGVVFPILDNTGALVTGAAGLDSEFSANGDTFTDCTNEATEIGSTGMYYLLLTNSEMAANVVAVITKTSTTDAKTTPIVLYPRQKVVIHNGTAQTGSSNSITLDSGASALDDAYNGMVILGSLDSNLEVRMITDYVGSTKVAAVTPNWVTTPDSDDTFIIYLPEGVQIPQANVVAVSGDATAADNLESYLDGSEFMPVDAFMQKFTVTGVTLQPKKPDGTTNTGYSRTVGTDPAAEPIVSST